MSKRNYYKLNADPEIIYAFRRTLGEIEWLLLVLVLFYLVVGQVEQAIKWPLILMSCAYAIIVASFHYWNFLALCEIQWVIKF